MPKGKPKRSQGKRGPAGKHGARGARGPQGLRGLMGLTGPRGPKIEHAEVLAVVDSELGEIRKHNVTQIAKTAAVLTKLDEIHNLLKRLIEDGTFKRAPTMGQHGDDEF